MWLSAVSEPEARILVVGFVSDRDIAMLRRTRAGVTILLLAIPAAAIAQDRPRIPPDNAMKLSEIVAKVEQRQDFRYVDDIEWSEEGYYDVTYYTTDKAKVEIKYNAVSGEPQ